MPTFPVPSLCHRNIWQCYMVLKYWTYCYGDASYILFLDQIVTICYPTSTYATGKYCALHHCFSLFRFTWSVDTKNKITMKAVNL